MRIEMKKTIILLAGIMLLAAVGFAAAQDVSPNLSIDVLDGAEKASPVNWNSDKTVWMTGTIDDINADGVIINDQGFRWSKFGTRYRDLDGAILSSRNFSKGTDVTYVLDGDRKTIVILIKGSISAEE